MGKCVESKQDVPSRTSAFSFQPVAFKNTLCMRSHTKCTPANELGTLKNSCNIYNGRMQNLILYVFNLLTYAQLW